MFFQYIVQAILAHPHIGETASHYHVWHVVLAFLVPLCVLVVAGIYILDLRKALRDAEEKNVELVSQVASHRGLVYSIMRDLRGLFAPLQDVAEKFEGADADLKDAGKVMAGKMRRINALLEVVNAAHERNQRDAQTLGEANAQAERNLSDLAEVRAQQLDDATKLRDGATALKQTQTVLFGAGEDEDTVVN